MGNNIDSEHENMHKLENILYTELANANVSVRTWKRTGGGFAKLEEGVIDIPRPKNAYRLGVAFHEIGHIHFYRTFEGYDTLPVYMMEFMAEQYAINKLKMYNLPTRVYRLYATKYVIACLTKYKNTGGNMDDVPFNVRKWTSIKIKKWKDAKKVKIKPGDINSISDIIINYD